MWSVPRYYEQDRLKQRVHLLGGGQSSMAWAREAEESKLLEADVRERLARTQQAG
jgi:hypothetical protein